MLHEVHRRHVICGTLSAPAAPHVAPAAGSAPAPPPSSSVYPSFLQPPLPPHTPHFEATCQCQVDGCHPSRDPHHHGWVCPACNEAVLLFQNTPPLHAAHAGREVLGCSCANRVLVLGHAELVFEYKCRPLWRLRECRRASSWRRTLPLCPPCLRGILALHHRAHAYARRPRKQHSSRSKPPDRATDDDEETRKRHPDNLEPAAGTGRVVPFAPSFAAGTTAGACAGYSRRRGMWRREKTTVHNSSLLAPHHSHPLFVDFSWTDVTIFASSSGEIHPGAMPAADITLPHGTRPPSLHFVSSPTCAVVRVKIRCKETVAAQEQPNAILVRMLCFGR